MGVLSAAAERKVEDKLISDGVLSAEKLQAAKQKAEHEHTGTLGILVRDGLISDEILTKTIAYVTKLPYVNLTGARIEPEVLRLLPRDVAERYMAVPLGEVQNRLAVAMLDAGNVQAADFLANKLGRPIKVYAASEAGLRSVLKQYTMQLDQQAVGALMSKTGDDQLTSGDNQSPKHGLVVTAVSQDSPISKALAAILEFAVRNRASDIHIEPLETQLKIRCRIDGVLREVMKFPKSAEAPFVSRVKILSNLKIDEHRIPQDGQFTVHAADRDVDLRIAISPVVWGEQVVIRLLDKSGTSLKLEDMGYTGRALRTIRSGLSHSNGMILTSGPTGSGKSTSMYALIQEIKKDSINIVTLEDPVEYKIDGINQIQVNPDVGLTFATGLRSVLRQDPDVIMVGEIRDRETATLAVQAALTGHLVFSTLHTNSAAGILPRLLDMGIEPFLIASTVHTVIGQRLVRRIGSEGKQPYESGVAETAAINATIGSLLPVSDTEADKIVEDLGYGRLPVRGQKAYTLYKGQDSPETPDGYKGRMGLYEVFDISESIQELVIKRATSSEIQRAAIGQGMITMRQDGFFKALMGLTTLTEVNRVAAADSI